MNYPLFLIPLAIGLFIQLIKTLGIIIRNKRFEWDYFFEHGHMPSAHTGFVISLLTTVGYFEGIASSFFAISFVLAYIIIDDALRFRKDLENHGFLLNKIINGSEKFPQKKYPNLKKRLGHNLSEVLVGGILGFVMTMILIFVIQNFA